MKQQHEGPSKRRWFWTDRPMGLREARSRIILMLVLAVAQVVAAYFGQDALVFAFKVWLISFAAVTLVRVFHTLNR